MPEKAKIVFEAMDAGHGDALLVRYPGTTDYEKIIWIDGGPASTGSHYKEAFNPLEISILPRLLQIKEEIDARGPEKDANAGLEELPLELAVCTHVHDDHIVGVLQFFKEKARNPVKLPGVKSLVVRELWHNSFSATLAGVDIIKATVSEIQKQSIGQGDALTQLADDFNTGVNLNIPGLLVAQGQVFEFPPMTITILNPGAKELAKLKETWDKESKTKAAPAGIQPSALGDGTVVFDNDDDEFNLSSITMLLEGFGRKILLTGDQLSENIVEALEGLNGNDGKPLKEKGKCSHFDIIKVPHHGSKANVQKRFVDEVTADIYVFSANGNDQNPDPEVLELFIAAAQKRKFIMGFTNGDFKYKKRKGKLPTFTDGTEVATLAEAIEHLRAASDKFAANVTIEFRGGDKQTAVKNEHALIYELSDNR